MAVLGQTAHHPDEKGSHRPVRCTCTYYSESKLKLLLARLGGREFLKVLDLPQQRTLFFVPRISYLDLTCISRGFKALDPIRLINSKSTLKLIYRKNISSINEKKNYKRIQYLQQLGKEEIYLTTLKPCYPINPLL